MSILLTRMFAYFTLGVYLIVGTAVVRVMVQSDDQIEFSVVSLRLFSPTKIENSFQDRLDVPSLSFQQIIEPKIKPVGPKALLAGKKPINFKEEVKVTKYELSFKEAIQLAPVYLVNDLDTKIVSLYQPFFFKEVVVADTQIAKDEVSTKQASTQGVPELFKYEEPETKVHEEVSLEASIADEELITDSLQAENSTTVDNHSDVLSVSELIAFDYSRAKEDVTKKQLPALSVLSSQPYKTSAATSPKMQLVSEKSTNKVMTSQKSESFLTEQKSSLVGEEVGRKYSSRLTIQVSGTDLSKTEEVLGFEIRPQDDLGEATSDYNSGVINLDETLAGPAMTRSVAILKRGFVPTNTDLILEEGSAEVTLPLIEESAFNELLAPFESMGPIGAVLVELGDDVESSALDVPYSKVLNLDEDMKVTSGNNFAYQLFVGVKAGNALLSYRKDNDVTASKIIHIHEHELTYEANFYESEKSEQFELVEENLLGRDKTPLIISSENVKEFATERHATKLNDHTYKMETRPVLLGSRKYLELSHQVESIFVGMKNESKLVIPSENYMRYILSKTTEGNAENRCVVQVNLSKEVARIDLGSESVSQSLQTKAHFVDSDGSFYESAGPKTEKVVIIGENQGNSKNSQDGKINVKILYVDGTVQYLSSYCSPSTYLVEQL